VRESRCFNFLSMGKKYRMVERKVVGVSKNEKRAPR
jgi:hypothetical protein